MATNSQVAMLARFLSFWQRKIVPIFALTADFHKSIF
jgi:hypothetical protein